MSIQGSVNKVLGQAGAAVALATSINDKRPEVGAQREAEARKKTENERVSQARSKASRIERLALQAERTGDIESAQDLSARATKLREGVFNERPTEANYRRYRKGQDKASGLAEALRKRKQEEDSRQKNASVANRVAGARATANMSQKEVAKAYMEMLRMGEGNYGQE